MKKLICCTYLFLISCSTDIKMTSEPNHSNVQIKNKNLITPFELSYSNAFVKSVHYLIYKEGYEAKNGFINPEGGDIHIKLEKLKNDNFKINSNEKLEQKLIIT